VFTLNGSISLKACLNVNGLLGNWEASAYTVHRERKSNSPFTARLADMRDHERAMLVYAKLADVSQQKQQFLGRDKFLILTAAAACRAGWIEVSARCRELVLVHNRSHLVGNFETFADALRSQEFEPFLKRLERFCGYERAEHLLQQLDFETDLPDESADQNSGEHVLQMLSTSQWSHRESDAG
jgi:hypothetical protein